MCGELLGVECAVDGYSHHHFAQDASHSAYHPTKESTLGIGDGFNIGNNQFPKDKDLFGNYQIIL